jgi:hypothetical protein
MHRHGRWRARFDWYPRRELETCGNSQSARYLYSRRFAAKTRRALKAQPPFTTFASLKRSGLDLEIAVSREPPKHGVQWKLRAPGTRSGSSTFFSSYADIREAGRQLLQIQWSQGRSTPAELANRVLWAMSHSVDEKCKEPKRRRPV